MTKLYIRNISISVLLILLILLVVAICKQSPFGSSETNFSAEPDKEITAIELSTEDQKVILSLTDDTWKVNSEYNARKSVITFFLRMLREIRIKSPVSSEMFNDAIVTKGIRPVRVEVYEKRKLLSSFYVYRTISNKYGNIMKIKEKSKPFIVYFPGFEGDIGSVFNPDELFWQPHTLFNLLPSEISSISLDNYSDTSSSFRIETADNNLKLTDLRKPLTGWDSSRVKRYISYYTLVPFESWAFGMSESERYELSEQKPLYRISVGQSDGKYMVLTLWEKINDGEKDTGRLWGKTGNNEEYMIIRYSDIDPLLRKLNYFYPKDE